MTTKQVRECLEKFGFDVKLVLQQTPKSWIVIMTPSRNHYTQFDYLNFFRQLPFHLEVFEYHFDQSPFIRLHITLKPLE